MLDIPTPVILIICVALATLLAWLILGRKRIPAVWNRRPQTPLKTRFIDKRQAILKVLSADRDNISQSRLQIKHVMTPNPALVRPEASTRALAVIMRKRECRHLLVCDENDQLVGVVSNRDVLISKKRIVARVMTPDPVSVTPDSLVSAAVTAMLNHQISCLPVVREDGQACGVVTTTDMMMTLQCMLKLSVKVDERQTDDKPSDLAEECAVVGNAAI